MARAVCALEAISRWAVTGTPIQNRLGDLASLLRFIRAHPYTDPKQFDADEAVKRLKRLSACLLLRRPKGAIDLPPRQDLVYEVDFTPEERKEYEKIRHQTITNIDEAFRIDDNPSKSHIYVNVLQQIESLRLFSNLGLYYPSRHTKLSQNSLEPERWNDNAQRAFNSQREMTSIVCRQCSSALGLAETLLDDTAHSTENAQFTSCLQFICSECCPVAPVSTSGVGLDEVEHLITPHTQPVSLRLPSKIKAIIEDIKGVPSDVKCIVFSTWRLTLDLITRGLEDEGIKSIRFDGKVPQEDRQSVLSSFNSDSSIRVMLLTLSCGAALARIHRLGQSREVETVRFYVRDSFEEVVINVRFYNSINDINTRHSKS
ncbi:DNA repair protein rad5 [Xylaria sp. FL1042]|nr:DNA repair protein rad5 [Xylaria sp. FL1042]